MLSSVTTKGQVTIPKKLRDALRIRPNDKVDFTQEGDRIVMIPLKTLKDFRGAVKSKGSGNFETERARAKASVGRRVGEEMK
jgi:antitoxin PrlF